MITTKRYSEKPRQPGYDKPMKLTLKKLEIIKVLFELELARKNNGRWNVGITGTDVAQRAASRGWVISRASAQTYLSDLKMMSYVDNDNGVAGSWHLTDAGRELARKSAAAIMPP